MTTTESTTEVTTKTTERATTSVTTREEPTTRAWKDNGSYKNNTSGNSYKSYDDGYDDVYMDGDYDDARYNSDSDYVRTERCTDRGFVCSGTDENGRRKACTCRCGNRGMCDNCDTP